MPKGLRFTTASLFFLFYLIATFLITYLTVQEEFKALLFSIGFASITILIESLVIYWVLGFSGKTYVKKY